MKSRVYDLSVLIQQAQQEITFLNAEIAKLSQPSAEVNEKLNEMAQEQATVNKES